MVLDMVYLYDLIAGYAGNVDTQVDEAGKYIRELLLAQKIELKGWCPECAGEGYHTVWLRSDNSGEPEPDHDEDCKACQGTGMNLMLETLTV